MTERVLRTGEFKRGDSIKHKTGSHTGTVLLGPHLGVNEIWKYLIDWDDYDGTTHYHTQEFIETYYVRA